MAELSPAAANLQVVVLLLIESTMNRQVLIAFSCSI